MLQITKLGGDYHIQSFLACLLERQSSLAARYLRSFIWRARFHEQHRL